MKKSTKITALIAVLLIPVSIGLFMGFALGVSDAEYIDLIPIDIGPELRTKDLPIRGSISQKESTSQLNTAQTTDYYGIGDTLDWLILDDYNGDYFFDTFELKGIGTTAELWVQVDMSYPDGREVPVITDANVTYMLHEFETDIAGTCEDYFGVPDFHDGTNSQLVIDGVVPEGTYEDESGRTVILVS